VRFEILMAVTVKIAVFWDLVPHSSVDKYQDFGETCCLHLLGNLRMEAAGSSKILVCNFKLHGVTSQKAKIIF
jgi:hypothetical protein